MLFDFISALQTKDIESLRDCPKSDLHNHGFLGGNVEYVEKAYGIQIPRLVDKLNSMEEMHQWVGQHIQPIFSDDAEGRLKAISAAFIHAKSDGIQRLELGDDVWAKCLYEDSAEKMTEAIKSLHQEHAPDISFRPQLGISRHCPIHLIQQWLEPFLDLEYYETIDLSGDESAQPIQNFKPIYKMAKKAGLVLKAHVGEWGGADSVKEAVEVLELDEVQHGIAASESVSIMNWLADQNIQLNICPTSNVMLGRVDSLEHHPIRELFDHGIRVTLNTDDMLVFNQSVSDEFLNLYEVGLFTPEELNTIRSYGMEA